MKRFDAVIFDLDGTLVDSLADIGDAMNHALGLRGFPLHSMEAYRFLVRLYTGLDVTPVRPSSSISRRSSPLPIRVRRM